jgi:HAD superfamily hydrolase (TIGR01509 family)
VGPASPQRARAPEPADDQVAATVEAVDRASELPEFAGAWERIDCSADFHRATYMRLFEVAGLGHDLGKALYELDFHADCHPYAEDALEVLRTLKDHDIKVAVISNIHFDFRPEFAALGPAECVDAFVLSFEHGVQKPDPAIFWLALGALQVKPSQALMVGDRLGHDGGAVALGIPTPSSSTR